jgi:hypothetical protein
MFKVIWAKSSQDPISINKSLATLGINMRPYSKNTLSPREWGHGSTGRAPAWQKGGPDFKLEYRQIITIESLKKNSYFSSQKIPARILLCINLSLFPPHHSCASPLLLAPSLKWSEPHKKFKL